MSLKVAWATGQNSVSESKRTKLSISGCLERVNQHMCCIYIYIYICVHIYVILCTLSIKKIIKTDFISLTKARKISNFPDFSWDIYHCICEQWIC